ncbi:MAG: hypothetical protein AMXMBFR7_16380 [Planctomycetota bacterium]
MRRPWQKLRAAAKDAYEGEDFPRAEQLLLDALRQVQKFPDHHRDRMLCVEDLAMLYRSQALEHRPNARFQLAERLYRSTLEAVESARGPDHPDVAERLITLAVAFYDRRPEEASVLLRRAQRIYLDRFGLYDGRVVMTYIFLGQNEALRKRYERAEARLRQAVQLAEKIRRGRSWFLAMALKNLGGLLYGLQRWPEAESAFRRVLACEETDYGAESELLLDALESLGRTLRQQGRHQEAALCFRRARDIGLRVHWGENPAEWS